MGGVLHDPFAPKSYREPRPRRAPDVPPLLRLRRAGLTPADEPVVRSRWAAMSDAERFEAAEAMENLDNDELRRQIEEMREEVAAEAALADYGPDPADNPPPEPEAKPKARRGRKARS